MQIGMAFVKYYVKMYVGLSSFSNPFQIAQMQIRPNGLAQTPVHITFECM